MSEPKVLKRGDRCPNCNGTFEEAVVPSDEQRARAANREDPAPLPPHYDTASKEFRAEHGALFRCTRCPYTTRFPIGAATASTATDKANA